MRIHLLSDLHLEFAPYTPEVLDADVTILAGDIDVKARGLEWAKRTFSGRVIYVPGNHEYYGGHLTNTLEKMRAGQDDRVHVLDREEVIIQGVRFLGATMWTDFASTGCAPAASRNAQDLMNDFRKIRTGNYSRIKPSDLVKQSRMTRDWLRASLDKPHDGPTVVITHHAPSLRSLEDNSQAGGMLDAAYANSWDDLMDGETVALWMHGHSHTAVDYEIAGTRVVCNPRGYPDEESTGFDPKRILSI
ncbi:metallophosphoesterase [Pseudomonas sp. 5Ae-yellow]|uniref:metallophosphoesterase n=1 Tax=Pseudomonas sp. 5Ae-yellow TaxID=2759848 RepID=UPI0015F3D47A|nr:metallophosphoesterase [Pseudomonas sp. 5Ae-yellow]MBA6421153.1 metallophosphoesterase family protein [Pseudomonas sp. 5Ae-yellow]